MFLNQAVLEKGHQDDALFVFLHSQRTGGSNFQRWLVSVFGQEQSYTQHSEGYADHWRDIKDFSVLDGKRLVGGFSYFAQHDLNLALHNTKRPVIFLSNVRHPAYRIMSLRNLAAKKETHFLHDVANLSPEEFYRIGRERKPWYFDDMQTRRISGGERSVKLATSNIQGHFGLVGLTDDLHAASKTLIDFYGWKVDPIAPLGVPRDAERYASRISTELMQEIEKNNANDVALYHFIANTKPGKLQPRKVVDPMAKPVPPADWQNELTIDDNRASAVREENPDTGYSAFFMKKVAAGVAAGKGHNTLGGNLVRDGESRGDFWEAGKGKADRFMRLLDIKDDSRVIDYGCGSLRLAAHFMTRLQPGNVFALDVTDDFYLMGKDLIGPQIINDKQPVLRVISAQAVEEAVAFGADAVYSSAVYVHVHPDEMGFYFNSLQRMAGKPGSRLIFDATLTREHIRYSNRSWGWTESQVLERADQLTCRRVTQGPWRDRNGVEMSIATFEFERPR